MITGTIVNYYYHCKRQCWLFSNKLNLEHNSEDVRIGKILHEIKNEKATDAIDNIKVDKITSEYIVEFKKSDADLIAASEQLKYYLYVLNKKGIERKGKLECFEKNKQNKKVHIIELKMEEVEELEKKYADINEFIESLTPPNPVYSNKCKKCAYFYYCFV